MGPISEKTTCDGSAAVDVRITVVVLDRLDIDFSVPVAYSQNPPSSGTHWPCWATYSVHTTVLPPEIWVHNLEHGGIVLLYQCPDAVSCPDAVAELAQVDADAPGAPTGGHRVLVTADPTLPTPFAAVAWDWVLSAQTVYEPDMLCFASAHEGQGPEDLSADGIASCQ